MAPGVIKNATKTLEVLPCHPSKVMLFLAIVGYFSQAGERFRLLRSPNNAGGLRKGISSNADAFFYKAHTAAQRDELQLFFHNRMTTTEEIDWMTLSQAFMLEIELLVLKQAKSILTRPHFFVNFMVILLGG